MKSKPARSKLKAASPGRKRGKDALRESEERYRLLFENSGEAILFAEPDGSIYSANPEACRIFGRSEDEIRKLGKAGIVDALDPRWQAALEERKRTGKFKGELNLLRKDGTIFPAEVSTTLFKDSKGDEKTSTIIHDITERKRAEEQLREKISTQQTLNRIGQAITAKLNLAEILELLEERILTRLQGDLATISLLDPATNELANISARGARHAETLLGLRLKVGEGGMGWVAQHGQPLAFPDVHQDRRWARSDVSEAEGVVSWLGAPLIIENRVMGVINVSTRSRHEFNNDDIEFLSALALQAAIAIQNSRLFDEVRAAHAQLQLLSRQLFEVQENERRDLTREMHDQIGQTLTALGLNLNIIRAQLPPESAAQVADRLNDSAQLIDEITDRVRDVITNLRPPVLDDYGVVAALHWYSDQFSKRTGLATVVRGAHTRRLPPPVETALFRIAQEALTNIAQHAQAKQVTIALDSTHQVARLTIADDGVGFNFDGSQFTKERSGLGLGLGLVGMKERANAVNAQLWIESAPAQGTKVVVEVRL